MREICLVRLDKTEDGETKRNDRVLAVAKQSLSYAAIKTTGDLAPGFLDTITSACDTNPCGRWRNP